MAKKIFQEKQQFRCWEVIGLLAFFIVGLTYRFLSQQLFAPIDDPISLVTYLVLVIPLVGCLWYLLSLRLSVKVTTKGISFKYSPWNQKRHKVKWEDIEEYEFLNASGLAQWSGWNISFDHEKMYSLNGRTGIHLRTKQGEDIIIGSRKLNEFKNAIKQVLLG